MKKRAWIQKEAMNEPKKNTSSSAPKGSSYIQALSYHTKCYIGPGALSLPLAFERSGTLSGLFIVLVVFSLTLRNQAALLSLKKDTRVSTYADLMGVALGKYGALLIEFFTNLTQLGIGCIYFAFCADHLQATSLIISSSARDEPPLSYSFCVLVYLPVFSALTMIPNVEAMAPFTGIANVLIFLPLCSVVSLACVYIATEGLKDGLNLEPYPAETSLLFYATTIYSLNGITNLLPVENSLANPSHAMPMLYVSMSIVLVIYILVGLMPHLAWSDTGGEAAITNYLLRQDIGGSMMRVSSISVIFSVILTFPVQLWPAIELWETRCGLRNSTPSLLIDNNSIKYVQSADRCARDRTFPSKLSREDVRCLSDIEEDVKGELEDKGGAMEDEFLLAKNDVDNTNSQVLYSTLLPSHFSLHRICLRLSLVTFCAIVAIACPNLEKLVGVVGASGGSLLVLVFPALISLTLRSNRNVFVVGADLICIVIGLLGAVIGSWKVATFNAE